MKYKFLYIIGLVGMVSALAGCSDEGTEPLRSLANTEQTNLSVIKLATDRDDGTISLSVDAPAAARTGVWIDLNGDGERAADGSEDVKVFNAYTDYKFPKGSKGLTVHGDITYLGCACDQLTKIEVTGNPYLTTPNCPQNGLTDMDLSTNPTLQRLDCSDNKIKSLDVSANTALVSLWCYGNQLTSLDVSGNMELAALDCSGNQLTALDVSKNLSLERLICYHNDLTSLDVSKNVDLNRLWIYGNPFPESEITKLQTMLSEVAKGDIWIGNQSTADELKEELSSKGWTVR